MEIKISTEKMLDILNVLSWIIFIGLCVEAGSFLFNAVFTTLFNPKAATYFGLTDLYAFDSGYFAVELLLMGIPAIMKAIMFYLIVKILHAKKLNLLQPFNKETGQFLFNIAYLAFGIGLFSYWGIRYTEWFVSQGIKMPDTHNLRLDGADVWIFMGVVLFVIAQIFKRGIEIQSENELTI